jgi:hypothetical protein
MKYDHKTYLQQVGLKTLKFSPGPTDGLDGKKTRAAFYASLNARYASTERDAKKKQAEGYPPAPNPHGKVAAFGPHGIKDGFTPPLKKVAVPWSMYLYKDGGLRVRTISCHKLIAVPLGNFLKDLYSQIGDDGIRKYGFHLWFGCYAPRKSRGGSAMSDHAWAIANDWNYHANRNHQRWTPDKKMPNGTHQFSKRIVAIARRHGFQVGFSNGAHRRDMMHFAYVNRS